MIGVLGEHPLQCGHDLGALRVRLSPARLPVIPWTEIHERLGVEHRDLVVLGELRRGPGHGGGVGGIEPGAVGLRVLGVARGQGCDQRPFLRACLGGQRARLLCRGERRSHRLFHHRHIDIGAEHQRLAPEAHGAIGVELLCLAECALRLLVIEGMGQPQTLIEIALGGRARRGDLVGERAEAIPQRRVAVGERQRGRCGIAPGLRHFGLHRDQADHAARHGSNSGRRALAEDEVPADVPPGAGQRDCSGGPGGSKRRRFGDALAPKRKQREAACARAGSRGQQRRPQSHDCYHGIASKLEDRASGPKGIRRCAVPRSRCAPTA